MSTKLIQHILEQLPRSLLPVVGNDMHYSVSTDYVWKNWDIYVGFLSNETNWHQDKFGQYAWNLLLKGSKTWYVVPEHFTKKFETFLRKKVDNPNIIKYSSIQLSQQDLEELQDKDMIALEILEQKTGDLFVVPPKTWHAVRVTSESTISMSANVLTWESLPIVVNEYNQYDASEEETLTGIKTTMHMDRIIFGSVEIFLNYVNKLPKTALCGRLDTIGHQLLVLVANITTTHQNLLRGKHVAPEKFTVDGQLICDLCKK